MPKKYWDDFKEGDRIRTDAITITEAHLVQWAGLTMDFHPLHMDEEYAKKTIFGGRIAHGPLTFAMATGLMFMTHTYADAVIAWLGVENMHIPGPVRIGDTISVDATVKERRETRNPERGITIFRYVVKNQKEQEVMAFDILFMMQRRISLAK
jgi:itaconyl-CoA hydratase